MIMFIFIAVQKIRGLVVAALAGAEGDGARRMIRGEACDCATLKSIGYERLKLEDQGMSRWLISPKTVVHVQTTTAPTAASRRTISTNLS